MNNVANGRDKVVWGFIEIFPQKTTRKGEKVGKLKLKQDIQYPGGMRYLPHSLDPLLINKGHRRYWLEKIIDVPEANISQK